MITFSAFADEIGPDLDLQMDTCEANGVKCIDVRGIDGINVSSMTLAQAGEYMKRLGDRGFGVPCIGSPIGKIKISDDFEEHLDLLKHTCDVARTFGTDRIRMFSFYPTDGVKIEDQRAEAFERFARMVELAEREKIYLYHENESGIYGYSPDGVKDLFATFKSDYLKGIFDPANFVNDGFRPFDECWTQGLAELTDAFHIKDKVAGTEGACVPAGMGDGQFLEIFKDLAGRGFDDYMTLEPHLAAAGQFKGHTGPELFKTAVDAVKALCDEAGLAYAE
jgi:3-dehydroshikimate dehydratase